MKKITYSSVGAEENPLLNEIFSEDVLNSTNSATTSEISDATQERIMQNIYRDGYDGQNIWIDFRDISLADQFPATISTAGDRTILPGTHYHSSIDYQYGRDFFRLQYTHEGMGRIVYRNPDGTLDSYDLGENKCVFIPKIQNFEYFNPDECSWNFIYINFRGEFAERVFAELLTKGPVHAFRKDSACVAEFQNLFHLARHRNLDACDIKKIAGYDYPEQSTPHQADPAAVLHYRHPISLSVLRTALQLWKSGVHVHQSTRSVLTAATPEAECASQRMPLWRNSASLAEFQKRINRRPAVDLLAVLVKTVMPTLGFKSVPIKRNHHQIEQLLELLGKDFVFPCIFIRKLLIHESICTEAEFVAFQAVANRRILQFGAIRTDEFQFRGALAAHFRGTADPGIKFRLIRGQVLKGFFSILRKIHLAFSLFRREFEKWRRPILQNRSIQFDQELASVF